jgi:trans-2,3-dihydro-3-hydroxyanthranilate isomerase
VTRLLHFHSIDVFTDSKFSGAPLAIVDHDPNLLVAEMQAIASEFGAPSVAFLGAPRDPVNSAGLRVFSGAGEQIFSAEAAIGAAALMAQTRAGEILSRRSVIIALELGAAVYPCEVIRSRAGISYAQFPLRRLPEKIARTLNPDAVAASLALTSEEIGFGEHQPRLCGLFERFACIPLSSRKSLEKARPAQRTWPLVFGGRTMVCLYTPDTLAQENALHIRSFSAAGEEESANGEALAAFLAAACEFERPVDGEHQMFIEQGHKLGRASRLTLGLTVEEGCLTEIRLGGQAVVVMRGELRL